MTPQQPQPDASTQTLEQSLESLAATIRHASESLLDLQEALTRLRVATEPRLANQLSSQVDVCLRNAMRN